MSEKYPPPDETGYFPINFRLRGLFANKIHESELAQRGRDATRYIRALGFILIHLDFHQQNSLANEFDANKLNYYYSSIGEMVKEFSDEALLVIDMLDQYKEELQSEVKLQKKQIKDAKKQI